MHDCTAHYRLEEPQDDRPSAQICLQSSLHCWNPTFSYLSGNSAMPRRVRQNITSEEQKYFSLSHMTGCHC